MVNKLFALVLLQFVIVVEIDQLGNAPDKFEKGAWLVFGHQLEFCLAKLLDVGLALSPLLLNVLL